MQMYVRSGIEARKYPQLPCPSSSAKGCDRWITHSDVTRLLKDYPKDLQVRAKVWKWKYGLHSDVTRLLKAYPKGLPVRNMRT